jgi:hypothetical protein
MRNKLFQIKNSVIEILKSGAFHVGLASEYPGLMLHAAHPKPEDICPACNNSGQIYVDYGQCSDPDCTAHRGFEACEVCNVRKLS